MIDTKNMARFVSCTQAQYDSLYQKEEDNTYTINKEKEIEDDNNSKSNSGEV